MGSQGQITSNKASGGGSSSLMGLMDMVKKMSSSTGGSGASDSSGNENVGDMSASGGGAAAGVGAGQVIGNASPAIGGNAGIEAGSAMDRRADTNASQPDAALAQGIKHVNDPNVPLDYDTRMAVAEPLFRAAHFGYGGGYEKGSQGQVTSGKQPDGGGASKVLSLASLLA